MQLLSEVRVTVSFITSASNERSWTAAAVRQTPLTATESPGPSSEASGVSIVIRNPSPELLDAATRPRSCTSPVNIRGFLPLLHPRRDQQVLPHLLAVERHRPDGVGDHLDPLALQRIAGSPAAQDDRRQEQADLIDLFGV